jgi:WXG100 family type VII secretion target
MSFLRVDTEVMAAGATKIQNTIDDIDHVLNLLNNDVNTMLSSWAGDAADAHAKMHDRFAGDARTIRNSLAEMCSALLRTHAIYVAQEGEQNADQVTMSGQILS